MNKKQNRINLMALFLVLGPKSFKTYLNQFDLIRPRTGNSLVYNIMTYQHCVLIRIIAWKIFAWSNLRRIMMHEKWQTTNYGVSNVVVLFSFPSKSNC
jgi:hypothetical protein